MVNANINGTGLRGFGSMLKLGLDDLIIKARNREQYRSIARKESICPSAVKRKWIDDDDDDDNHDQYSISF